jgi:hypothetical protein
LALVLLVALALAGCSGQGIGVPSATAPPAAQQQISIEVPQPGTTIGSPSALRGRTSQFPFEGNLIYRVFDGAGQQIGTGPIQVQGNPGQASTFDTRITFTATSGGPGRIEVLDLNSADGSVRAIASMSVTLESGASGAGALPTPPTPAIQPPVAATPTLAPLPPSQAIAIDSPAPGTVVGSPVVLAGRTALFPTGGVLNYRVIDANGNQLGNGSVNVAGSSGQPGSFNASLTFREPQGGGVIRAELSDPSNGSSASVDMFVAPPQAITITSPSPGTQVGSPVVLTGQLARLPFQSSLSYRVVTPAGQQLGAGTIPVDGAPGQPTSFIAEVRFAMPPAGGPIRAELTDQNGQGGVVAASAAIDLQVAPQPQAISIDTPAPGQQVGSPVVLTGRTVQYPAQGKLIYQISDANGNQIGRGAFNVNGNPGQSSSFNASLLFNLPPNGGPIRVDLLDQNAQNGVVIASSSIDLTVAPPQPVQQIITIETPPNGTLVGSPVVITGRTTRYPFEGSLSYRILDQNGRQIGAGAIQVNGAPGSGTTFVGSLQFQQPPQAGTIRVEIYERDVSDGTFIAIAAVELQVDGAPYPQPRG